MRYALFVFVAFWASGPVQSQVVSSGLIGFVTDPSDAGVRGAEVTAQNQATGLARSTLTDDKGAYALPQLPPGRYRLSAAAAGFKQATVTDVDLLVERTARVDVRLQVGDVSQTVEVAERPAAIESEGSGVGQVVERRNIVDLPLNGRNFLQLANTSPGVSPAYNARSATITNQSGRADMAVHISGGRGDTNSYLIDGVETRSTWFNSPSVLLSVDAIQEFRVDRNLFSAVYGQGSGLVSVVSRSGSNALHGSAFEFLRNDRLDAANYFDNYFGNRKAPFRQNQFGASAGGALVRDRLFFFGSWEALRSRRSATLNGLLPTAEQLGGNLTGIGSTHPSGAAFDPFAEAPFAGNRIPASRLSHVTRNFRRYIPEPNANAGGRNYVVTRSTQRNDDQGGGRIDYNVSGKDTLFGRFTSYDSSLFQPRLTPLSGSLFPYRGQNAVLQYTRVLSARTVNNVKVGFNHAEVFNSWENTPTSLANELGIRLNQTPAEYGLPAVSLAGGWNIGGGAGINQGGVDHLWQFSDTVSWFRGRHQLRFGTDLRKQRFDLRLGLNNNGSFTFDDRYTGNALGDFLLGTPAQMTAQIGLGVGRFRWNSYNFFLADDFKVSPRLTLNLGLRYEYDQPPAERDGREGYFDTSLNRFVVRISRERSPIQRDIAGLEFRPDLQRGIWFPDRNNIAPRVGFAYRLSEKTSLRGGYGIFFAKTQGNELQFKINAPPLVFAATLVGATRGNAPNLSWDRDAFPDPASPAFPVATLSPFSVDPRDRSPYLQQWNLSLSQVLPADSVLEISYVGSKGTFLAERVNINQAALPTGTAISPIAARRPFPGFGDILSSNFQENSSYQALQTRWERRFFTGFALLAGYTWSKSIDTASRGSGGSWHQNARRLRDDRGPSDFDVRHRLAVSGVYQLPFGRGRRFLPSASGWAQTVAGGWSVNSILSLQTGNLFSAVVAGDRANVGGFPFQRANRLCDGNLPRGQRTIDRYFDTACFVTTQPGTFGSSGRNILEIPGLNNWDVSFLKETALREGIALQFRAEFFNLFNHAQFNQPDLSVDSRFFGQVRGARDARISQLALKVLW